MKAVRLFPPGLEASSCGGKGYYIIERMENTSVGILQFRDYADLSEYINSDYAEDRNYPKEDLMLREDGVVCRIDPATSQNELVDFIETSETVSLSKLNENVASLCRYYRLSPDQYRISCLAELPGVLDQLCEQKREGLRRFERVVWCVIAGALAMILGWIVFR